jgi:hypothetical protein
VLLAFLLAAAAASISSRLGLALALRPPPNRILQPLQHAIRGRRRPRTLVTMSGAGKRTSGRKRKEVNYNEEKVIPALDEVSGDEGKGAKKGRSTFIDPKILPGRKPLPTRQKDGTYKFEDHPEFRPNLSPKEVRRVYVHACA